MREHSSKSVILLFAAGLAACGSSGGTGTQGPGSGSVRVTGTYAPYLGPASAGSPRIAVAAAADSIVAVPMERGSLSGQTMSHSVAASLAGQTFSLDLSKRFDWLLLLVNSSATGENRFRGAVNLRTALDDGLIDLPLSGVGGDAIPVGTVTAGSGGDAMGVSTVDSTVFQLTADQLEALAKADDLFRNAKNLVNNYGTFGNPATVWYQLRPDFSWDGDPAVTTAFSDPTALTYRGMQFQLDTNSTAVGMDAICTSSTVVTLDPPAVVTVDGGGAPVVYGPGSGFTSAGATCTTIVRNDGSPGREFWSGSLYGSDGYGGMSYSVSVSIPTNPPGYWVWSEGSTVRAKFDVSGVQPPVDGGKPAGFVPSFKVNVDGTGRITSVDIQWFTYDRTTGTYALLAPADVGVLEHFVGGVEVKFDRSYGGQRETEEIYVDPVTTSRVVPTQTWYYGLHPADPSRETGLMGFYETGGFGFFFNFRPPLSP